MFRMRTWPRNRLAPLRAAAASCCLALLLASSSTSGQTAAAAAAAAAAGADERAPTAEEHLNSQIEWIRSRGGFYSSKIEYRRMDPLDPSSPMAMFVAEPVDEGEVLMVIPNECLLTTGTESEELCDTVTRLAREYELGEESSYHPYVRYVFDPRHEGQVPRTWSEEGQDLLRDIAGTELFRGIVRSKGGFDIIGEDYGEACGEGSGEGSELLRKAYHHVARRSWEDVMIPVLDMLNHRNAPYKNVDSNSAHVEGGDVRVVALRDIKAGEQLYLSYNECTDCVYTDYYAYTYTLHRILGDYGFVEQYPQRWNVFGGRLIFQIEEEDPDLLGTREDHQGSGRDEGLKLRWFNPDGPPGTEELEWLKPLIYGHFKYLNDIQLEERVKGLPMYESYTSAQLHSALMKMLQHLIWYVEDFSEEAHVGGTVTAPVTYGVGNEPLKWYSQDKWAIDQGSEYSVEWGVPNDYPTCSQLYINDAIDGYALEDTFKSFHQTIEFWRSRDNDDLCLKIGNEWESCQSNRAHYHETLVHHSASFVPEVRRVMFLGGGDSMILHEVLKYESLEVVVGLELDKSVVQASFEHFKTQPHFDKNKVEWWFGDATLSLKLLPRDYLASFDLIIVDLQSSVIEMLDIMEAVRPYAHPLHGMVARNVNEGFATNAPFAQYSVDLYDGDVPLFCFQTITIGSDAVDLLTAERYVHDVENLYYDTTRAANESTRFDMWYHYRNADEIHVDARELVLPEAPPSAGILMVLELEEISAGGIWADGIADAIRNAGIRLTGSRKFRNSTMFLGREGYVTVRAFPQERYCAVDALLWRDYRKMYDLEKSLVSALGSGVKSSYRIVTSGLFGATQDYNKIDNDTSDEESESKESRNGDNASQSFREEEQPKIAADISFLASAAMQSALSSFKQSNLTMGGILVLCGEDSQACGAQAVAENLSHKSDAISIIHACPVSHSVFSCESDFRSTIKAIAKEKGKLGAIMIDAAAPMRSGQILDRILQRAKFRSRVLSDDIFVLGVATGQSSSSSWLPALLDRFRTDFFPYNPSFHAEVVFHPHSSHGKGNCSGESKACLGLSIYSAGNDQFYRDLVSAVSQIETATGLSSDVRYVQDGLNNYIAEFEPSQIFSHEDYDDGTAEREQHDSQRVLGRQNVIQYEAEGYTAELFLASIKSGLAKALSLVDVDEGGYKIRGYKIGEGAVIFALWEGGDASVVYDGRSTLNLNVFTLDVYSEFLHHFSQSVPSYFELELQDIQPRGIGRVVTF